MDLGFTRRANHGRKRDAGQAQCSDALRLRIGLPTCGSSLTAGPVPAASLSPSSAALEAPFSHVRPAKSCLNSCTQYNRFRRKPRPRLSLQKTITTKTRLDVAHTRSPGGYTELEGLKRWISGHTELDCPTSVAE